MLFAWLQADSEGRNPEAGRKLGQLTRVKLKFPIFFHSIGVPYPDRFLECFQSGLCVSSTSSFTSPSCRTTCKRAWTAVCRARKRFQLRYVPRTRDRAREPYFSVARSLEHAEWARRGCFAEPGKPTQIRSLWNNRAPAIFSSVQLNFRINMGGEFFMRSNSKRVLIT